MVGIEYPPAGFGGGIIMALSIFNGLCIYIEFTSFLHTRLRTFDGKTL